MATKEVQIKESFDEAFDENDIDEDELFDGLESTKKS